MGGVNGLGGSSIPSDGDFEGAREDGSAEDDCVLEELKECERSGVSKKGSLGARMRLSGGREAPPVPAEVSVSLDCSGWDCDRE